MNRSSGSSQCSALYRSDSEKSRNEGVQEKCERSFAWEGQGYEEGTRIEEMSKITNNQYDWKQGGSYLSSET